MENKWQGLMKKLCPAQHLKHGYNSAANPAQKAWLVIESRGEHGPRVILAGEFLTQGWDSKESQSSNFRLSCEVGSKVSSSLMMRQWSGTLVEKRDRTRVMWRMQKANDWYIECSTEGWDYKFIVMPIETGLWLFSAFHKREKGNIQIDPTLELFQSSGAERQGIREHGWLAKELKWWPCGLGWIWKEGK